MSNLSNAVRALEDQRIALESEIAKIDQRLKRIGVALGSGTARVARSPSAPTAASKPAGKRASRKKSTTRRWFEPGEALALMQKLITKPTRPTDVFKQLAVAKGYAGKLSKKEMDRFIWSATAALKAAVDAKKLIKRGDGVISATSA